MKFKRIFLMVLNSVGVGEAKDAANYGDIGSNTLGHIKEQTDLFIPNLKKIGFLDTINMNENSNVDAYYTIAEPNNAGKDSLNAHYEMMGITNNIEYMKLWKLPINAGLRQAFECRSNVGIKKK